MLFLVVSSRDRFCFPSFIFFPFRPNKSDWVLAHRKCSATLWVGRFTFSDVLIHHLHRVILQRTTYYLHNECVLGTCPIDRRDPTVPVLQFWKIWYHLLFAQPSSCQARIKLDDRWSSRRPSLLWCRPLRHTWWLRQQSLCAFRFGCIYSEQHLITYWSSRILWGCDSNTVPHIQPRRNLEIKWMSKNSLVGALQ